MTRTEIIELAKSRHPNSNWITAFAAEIGVSYWTIYRLANNKKAKVSELVQVKVHGMLTKEMLKANGFRWNSEGGWVKRIPD